MKHCFEFMEFAASVSERDPGVKVIDFGIKIDSNQTVHGDQIIANMAKLVADLKRASQADQPQSKLHEPEQGGSKL
jgi:hypothetical protein